MTGPGQDAGADGGAVVLDQPWQIELFRLAAFRQGLALQARGIKVVRGPSVLSRLRGEGIVTARTVAAAIPQLDAHIAEVKAGYGLICTVCRTRDTDHAITGETGQTFISVCDHPGCTHLALIDADGWGRPDGGSGPAR